MIWAEIIAAAMKIIAAVFDFIERRDLKAAGRSEAVAEAAGEAHAKSTEGARRADEVRDVLDAGGADADRLRDQHLRD